jgi:hypothetical protein
LAGADAEGGSQATETPLSAVAGSFKRSCSVGPPCVVDLAVVSSGVAHDGADGWGAFLP